MTERPAARSPIFLEGCLFVAAWFSLTGWTLSLLGCLNRGGYLASILLGIVALGGWLRAQRPNFRHLWRSFRNPWRRRIRRPLPALFAVIFALAALGGALHPPNNYDALTYRLPQLLHWLDAGRWHWIASSSETINITPPGFGWLMAPGLALARTDRLFFLPNIVAFALLPGLFFSAARGYGVRPRVAWYWMWILPSGYCFAMQAGGIANDALPAVYLLAALALAFRARRTSTTRDAWFSMVAAALATGVKVVVVPLGLPWLVAIAPAWRLLLRRPLGTVLVALVGLAISFLPTAIFNAKYTGDWSGDQDNHTMLRVDRPVPALVGNSLEIAFINLQPPIWPFPDASNTLFSGFEKSSFGHAIRTQYPRFDLRWFEMAGEDGAGIGLGIFVLAGTVVGASVARSNRAQKKSADWSTIAFTAAVALAYLAYAIKMGSEAAPRLITAYYPFILLLLLRLPACEALTSRTWWRVLAWLCAASVVPVLILTPARPLWPAQPVLAKLSQEHPDSAFLHRSLLVYNVFAARHDYLAPLKKFIPPGARTVGFVPTGNDLEGSLWRPFGSRRVVEVLHPTRTDSAVQQLSGSVIVCSPRGLSYYFGMTPDEFAAAIGGHIIGQEMITLKAVVGPELFCVIAVD